jgi:uncharacterized SAM-binding protein YcdF (DUF218 family)
MEFVKFSSMELESLIIIISKSIAHPTQINSNLVNLQVKHFPSLIKRYWFYTLIGYILTLLLIIPVRLAIAVAFAPQPQAFLILGGDPARETFTAEFAKWYPSLEIWVSSPPDIKKLREVFQIAGIPSTRLHIDTRAVDTVTNFTSLVADFQQQHIQHLCLITSDYHMPRAKAIAIIILGSQGITFTPVSVPSNQPKESLLRVLRDIARSFLWILTSHTGARFQFLLTYPTYAFGSI